VLLHAITDALIGGAGIGDIGVLFPDTLEANKHANSRTFLRQVNSILRNEYGFSIGNIDTTVIIDQPKLRDYIDLMRKNIADDLGIELTQINVKAKTSEGIGIVGRGEAVIAEAVVLLIK
ncbi:MAG: 2-C-methyl-D-erythritol 2,4-cyclodiphosphate synthase, partial [Burkholderiales bacterium]|nr:2-C-methyl-D-erythritol 2,4-cyclodiphosphate synthase [Burkholderiales bacterium]